VQFDYKYLCNGLGHLTGIETRIYKDGQLIEHYANYNFKPDIIGLVQHEIDEKKENAFYIETEDLLVFGIVRSKKDKTTLVIGPTSQITPGKQETIAILHMLNESYNRLPDLEAYFSNMIPYPFGNFLEILCFVNYALNDEKLSIAQLIEKGDDFQSIYKEKWEAESKDDFLKPHHTFETEKMMLSYITAGNVDAVQSFFHMPPIRKIGTIAHNELRQRKNTFICAATLMSRAAITGGMSSESAFTLSDRYIQKAEMLTSDRDITVLHMEMILDYTNRVEALKCGVDDSRCARKITRYVLKNLSSKITISDIADALNMNRSYICERFKLETGNTIGDFISFLKIDEAKRMLTVSQLSIAQLSDYLAFSSQSYFQTVFKKYEGCTPKEYKDKVPTNQD